MVSLGTTIVSRLHRRPLHGRPREPPEDVFEAVLIDSNAHVHLSALPWPPACCCSGAPAGGAVVAQTRPRWSNILQRHKSSQDLSIGSTGRRPRSFSVTWSWCVTGAFLMNAHESLLLNNSFKKCDYAVNDADGSVSAGWLRSTNIERRAQREKKSLLAFGSKARGEGLTGPPAGGNVTVTDSVPLTLRTFWFHVMQQMLRRAEMRWAGLRG